MYLFLQIILQKTCLLIRINFSKEIKLLFHPQCRACFFFIFAGGGGGGGMKPVYPQIFNLASRAVVTANATCGETENGPEVYCKYGGSGAQQCTVCDSRSSDSAKTHGPANAVDNATGTWWQSPSLQNGDQYQYVTFTIDLKQASKTLQGRTIHNLLL